MALTPDLVIFDCDGVLVDSEPISNKALVRILNKIGLKITYKESLDIFLGRSWEDSLNTITKMLGHNPPPNLYDLYRTHMYEWFKKELKPVSGVTDAVRDLKFPYCVASSGSHEKIQTTLGLTNLIHLFKGKIFSASDVPKGKPEPDLFLFAAKMMGANPLNTVVVEDSEPGVRAAIAANMRALGYTERTDPLILSSAGAETFDNMAHLSTHISNLS